MTIHTRGRSPAHAVLCLNDLDTRGDEPRVYDLTLARALGYEHARNIRRLIRSAEAELKTHDDLIVVRDRSGGTGNLLSGGANRVTPRAGRPGTAYYLTEGQALVVCALSRTATAAHVRGELIRVFMLYRARVLRLYPKAVISSLVPAERQALQQILRQADVVMAPPMASLPLRDGMFEYPGIDAVAQASDGHIPYLLAPVTTQVLDTLSAFEEELADLEENGDDEPSLSGSGSGGDFEQDGADMEPALGSLDRRLNQTKWAGDGRNSAEDAELDRSDSEPSLGSPAGGIGNQEHWAQGRNAEANGDEDDWNGDEQDHNGSDDDPEFGPSVDRRGHPLLRAEIAATRAASHRLRGIVHRLQSAEARGVQL